MSELFAFCNCRTVKKNKVGFHFIMCTVPYPTIRKVLAADTVV